MTTSPTHNPLIWTPATIKKFWAYMARRETPHFSYQASNALLHQVAHNVKDCQRVLDYGCGPGYLIDALLRRGFHVAGVEYADQLITLVENKFKGNPKFDGVYPVASIAKLGTFDGVFVLEVIEHLYDPELNELFSNLKTLVAPGGRLVMTTRNQEDLSLEEVYCPSCDHVFHRVQHVRSWTPAQVTEFCAKWDFEVERLFCTDLGILSANIFYRLKYRLQQLIGRAKYPNLICVARRK